jgi:hypothetical protein
MEKDIDLADDLLSGADAIREFLGPTFTNRRIYHLAEKGALPISRLPGTNTLFARKSQLRQKFEIAA